MQYIFGVLTGVDAKCVGGDCLYKGESHSCARVNPSLGAETAIAPVSVFGQVLGVIDA